MYYTLTGNFINDTFKFYCIRLVTQVTEYTQNMQLEIYDSHSVISTSVLCTSISILAAVQNNSIKKLHHNHTVRVGFGNHSMVLGTVSTICLLHI